MQTFQLQAHVGADGLLKLEVPLEWHSTYLEVLLVIQPRAIATTPTVDTLEARGWSPGFFEQTAGSLADDPIERPVQGEYEVREELV